MYLSGVARMAIKHIDGNMLEGGGQILRNAVSLSALLRQPVTIDKIRNGRKPPGLKNQHCTGIELAARMASAELTGASVGSTEIEFIPRKIDLPGAWKADSVTAGSVSLLLQVALPLLLFSPSREPVDPSHLLLLGGTNAAQAPQVDYAQHILLPFLREHFGVKGAELDVRKRGYFPKGGGEVEVQVSPFLNGERLKAISLMNRGRVTNIEGIAHCAKLPANATRRIAAGARGRLAKWEGEELCPADIVEVREEDRFSRGPGCGIVLWAHLEGGGIIGGSALGKRGMSDEQVGELAANELIRGLKAGGCVDEWLQDQIVIFMALAEGKSEVDCGIGALESHTLTAIWLAEQLTNAKFEVEEDEKGHTILRCEGIGYTAPDE